ncbi:MAG: hypothetical protein JO265_05700 [Acidimicrobiia bacterium]|nr:hypothetical protein [Acidimicrobiia bacterium]
MLGAIILVICMLLMVPLILVVGGVTMGLLGWSAQADVEQAHKGSELLELNR